MNEAPSSLSASMPLRLLQVLIGLFMILTAITTIVVAIRALNGEPPDITIEGEQLTNPPIWMLTIFFALALTFQWLIWHLYRVIGRARRGAIFSLANVHDLRRLGFACLAWWLSPLWLSPLVTGRLALGGKLSTSDLLTSPLTLALVFFVFAEVLREGLRLREAEQTLRAEQELTI